MSLLQRHGIGKGEFSLMKRLATKYRAHPLRGGGGRGGRGRRPREVPSVVARGCAGDLVVLGARADAELSRVAALGPGTRHGGGVFIMDVVRVFLARVSGAVPAERADAV